MKAISLHQPRATWIAWGWKTVETRTHNRFRSLQGQRIAIHAAHRYDPSAFNTAAQFLTIEQIDIHNEWVWENRYPKGAIVCTAEVFLVVPLAEEDGPSALIECPTGRVGLFLVDVKKLAKPIPWKGRQGIFEITEWVFL